MYYVHNNMHKIQTFNPFPRHCNNKILQYVYLIRFVGRLLCYWDILIERISIMSDEAKIRTGKYNREIVEVFFFPGQFVVNITGQKRTIFIVIRIQSKHIINL